MQRTNETKEILGLNRITKKRIMELCKKDKLYQTPELNDVLYLHYQGFECIECLEDYTELKCLWLECNAISEIQGLEKQAKLKCLFLQSNLIRKIENLDYCKELDTINLSQNHIRKIENCGFEILPVLNTLNLSSNYLKDCEGLRELENCKNLSVLDLSNNRIDDILVVKIFAKMPELRVLVLQGNPVVSKIPQYRKTLILECEKLTYLDSRPVFPKDRACAEAWKRGGYEEERKENERWNRRERKKMRDGVNATIHLRNRNRKPEDQISLIPSSSDSEDESKNAEKKNLQNRVQSEVVIDSMWDEVSEDKQSERSSSTATSCESKISETSQSCESNNEGEEKENDERMVADDKHSIRFSGFDTSYQSKIMDSNKNCGEKFVTKIEAKESDNESVQNHDESVKEQMLEKDLREKVEKSEESEKILGSDKLKNSSLASLNQKESLDQKQSILETKSMATKSEKLFEPPSKKVQLQIENYKDSEIWKSTPLNPSETKLNPPISILKQDKSRSDHFLSSSMQNVQLPIDNCKGFEMCSENSESTHLPPPSEVIESNESELNHPNNVLKQDPTKSSNCFEFSRKKVQLHIENCEQLQNSNVYDVAKDSLKNYQSTIEAIRNITKADVSPESSLNKISNKTEENDDEDDYEPLQEMEDAMNILNHNQREELSVALRNPQNDLKKSQIELETEQERLKVNQQLKTDFEELSTNLSNFVDQLDQDQKERQEVFRALYNTNLAPKETESTESSGSEEKYHLEERKLDRMIDMWDKDSKLRKDTIEIKLKDKEQIKERSKADVEEVLRDSLKSCPTTDIKVGEDLKDSIAGVAGNIIKLEEYLQYKETSQIPAVKLNSSTSISNKFDYIPMDISLLTRKSNEALNSLERESKELKRLLQQLEDKNEDLFKDINAEMKCEEEESVSENLGKENEETETETIEVDCKELKSEIKYEKEESIAEKNENLFNNINTEVKWEIEEHISEDQEKESEEAGKDNMKKRYYEEDNDKTNVETDYKDLKSDQFKQDIVKREETFEGKREQHDKIQIAQTIVEELLKSLELKQKTYKFPESLEELPTKTQSSQQTPSSSIPEFVKSFNEFYKDIEMKDQEKLKHFEDKEKRKSFVLKELARQTNLKEFNNDSLESLDAQLEEIKRVEHERVRRLIDRVYAQKDRYNDTLELVEGKLMVRHRDTQELRELPQPVQQDSSDSEADYDTAQSEEEENGGGRCSKVENRIKRKPYRPTARKSSMDLIIQALISNKFNKVSDDSEESNDDEFYSLDTQDPSRLYKEIDKEFFNKLTLENLKHSHVDENHIVQCARSYEELKHCLTLSKEERCLTEEENALLENMIERKCVKLKENPETLRETLQNKIDLTAEEEMWFKKMPLKSEEPESEGLEGVKDELQLKSSQEAIQLFAYKHDKNTEVESNTSKQQLRESSGNSMLKDLEPLRSTSEDVSKHLMKQILLKKLVEQKEKLLKDTILEREKPEPIKSDREFILSYERQSEEEKNEIESNIDFESGASSKKTFKSQEFKEENQKIEVDEVNATAAADELIPEECLSNDDDDDVVGDNSAGVEILECNLEIIGCNDELVDTITVNAEVHF